MAGRVAAGCPPSGPVDAWVAGWVPGESSRDSGFESQPNAVSSAQQITPHASCRMGRLSRVLADVRAKTIVQDQYPVAPAIPGGGGQRADRSYLAGREAEPVEISSACRQNSFATFNSAVA